MRTDVFKKTILVDLDGVLNQYTGKFDKNVIPPIKDGAREFLEKLSENFYIKIFTTRNKLQTANWLKENSIEEFISDMTNVKDLAWLYIDDRCVRFDGNFTNTIEEIQNFEPWYKKLQ